LSFCGDARSAGYAIQAPDFAPRERDELGAQTFADACIFAGCLECDELHASMLTRRRGTTGIATQYDQSSSGLRRQTETEETVSDRKRSAEKIQRTPEELAELREERARFSRERPGPEDLIASGDYEGPYRHGNIMALLSAIAELQRYRDVQGLSLADVSKRSGLDRGLLSRLENGKLLNPTISTLWRYANAIGAQISLAVEPPMSGADS
jgi:hypothetical protein